MVLPLQALVSRDPAAEAVFAKNNGKTPKDAPTLPVKSKAVPQQGVYVVTHDGKKMRCAFRPVSTGVTGSTEIQVTSGLSPGDEVVTGRFKTLRTLKSGTAIKLDTSTETTSSEASS